MSKWISVEDRLPKYWESVLIYPSWQSLHDFSTAYRGKRSDGEMWSVAGTSGGSMGKNITHWMPLPEPPKD